MSDYLELKVLDHVLATASFTMPTQLYLALYTAAPSDAGGGTEVAGNGYARQSIDFSAAAAGATSNSNAVSFTAAGGNWGSITHWGLFDALTVGNLLIWGAFNVARTINDGDTLTVPVGDLDVTAA